MEYYQFSIKISITIDFFFIYCYHDTDDPSPKAEHKRKKIKSSFRHQHQRTSKLYTTNTHQGNIIIKKAKITWIDARWRWQWGISILTFAKCMLESHTHTHKTIYVVHAIKSSIALAGCQKKRLRHHFVSLSLTINRKLLPMTRVFISWDSFSLPRLHVCQRMSRDCQRFYVDCDFEPVASCVTNCV